MKFSFNAARHFAAVTLLTAVLHASAQTPPPAYGAPITIEQAKKIMVAAEVEARRNGWQVVISIVDTGGHLVMLQRLDAQNASINIATGKASTAVNFRRPTKARVRCHCKVAYPSW
jgi:glc operon protein GlcG